MLETMIVDKGLSTPATPHVAALKESLAFVTFARVGDRVILLSDTSTPRGLPTNRCVRPQTAAGETIPDFACILSASEDFVRLEYGITSVEETRAARLQLHAIDDELENECIAVPGYELSSNLGAFEKSVVRIYRAVNVHGWE